MKNIIKNITEACKAQFEIAVAKEIESLTNMFAAYKAAPDAYEFWTKHFGICPSMMKKTMHDRYYALSRKMYMVANNGWELFTETEKAQMVENLSSKLIEAVTKHCQGYSEISNIELTATEKGYTIAATLDNTAKIKTDCILVWGPIVSAHYRYICKVK